MTYKNSKSTKQLKNKAVLKFKTTLYSTVYVAMWPLVMYSNYFEIFSTVIFLLSQTGLG